MTQPRRSSFGRVVAVATALLALLALAALAGCPSGGSKSAEISGRIDVTLDQEVVPLAQANVSIRPMEPDTSLKKVDEAPELTTNLLGVATTNASGSFTVGSLASNQTFIEYPLMRGWKYQIKIEAPGYYIYQGTFPYEKGASFLEIKLETKEQDVLDETGIIEIPEGGIQFGGATPRRGT